jgi:hypothetical protein
VKIIVTEFPLQPDADQQANGDTDRKAADIQQGGDLVVKKATPGCFELNNE